MSNSDGVSAEHDAPAPDSIVNKLVKLITSRYAISVGAQILMSGFHFAVSFVLIQLITPYAFGIYAFAFVLAMFASAINNALISTPLTVYTPVIKDEHERSEQEAMFSTLNLMLFIVLIGSGAIYGFVSDTAI